MKYENSKLIAESGEFESEFGELVNANEYRVMRGEDHRWTQDMTTIISLTKDELKELCPKSVIPDSPSTHYFSIDWSRGLTEEQENEFYDDTAVEVFPHKEINTEIVERFPTVDEYSKKENFGKDLLVAADPEVLDKIKTLLKDIDLDSMSDFIKKLSVLNGISESIKLNQAVTLEYLKTIKNLQNNLK